MSAVVNEKAKCELCGEPMPPGQEMFKFHGYDGKPCPKPSLPEKPKAADQFAWLIEMQGPAYLAVRNLGGYEFFWTPEHDKAIRFHTREQADLVAMAVRELRRDLFPAIVTQPVMAVEHGWCS